MHRVLVLFALAVSCYAQSTSGSITGSAMDPQKAGIPRATVTIEEQDRKFTFKTESETSGRFGFAQVPPGTYTLTIEAQGFKKLEQKGITLSANERRSLGDIILEVGALTQSVEVSAAVTALKLESVEQGDTLTSTQVENIAVNGRNPLALMALLPGVVSTADFTTSGSMGIGSISANGAQGAQNRLTLNGISNQDTGGNTTQLTTVSIDAVEEFRVLTGTYQAEFGRSAGAQIQVITKSGSAQFRATGYWNYRNEWMNANNWMNNRDGRPKNVLRQNNFGYTFGGPIYIPKLLTRTKDKLFFFWSEEFQRQAIPSTARQVTVPTALELKGDFSQSVDNLGRPYTTIKDPTTGKPFSNSKIPDAQFYAPGIAFLNLLPPPNVTGVAGYNYESQFSDNRPRREDTARIDYNLSDKSRLFGHGIINKHLNDSAYSGTFGYGRASGLPFPNNVRNQVESPGYGWGIGHTYLISPQMTNEFVYGVNYNSWNIYPQGDTMTRTKSGASFALLYPSAVTGDFIPTVSYSGQRISNGDTFTSMAQMPLWNEDKASDLADNLSWINGRHMIKVGVSFTRDNKNEMRALDPNGNFNFGDSSLNPLDTGFGLANVELGVFQTYTQWQRQWISYVKFYNLEVYGQDTWKVTPTLTLDYGLRVAWYQPTWFEKEETPSTFVPSLFDPAKSPRLYWPTKNAAGQRVAVDRVTGEMRGVNYIGTRVPGTGVALNGIVLAGQNGMSRYLRDYRPPQLGPRFGIAWDVTGRQYFVIRTGGGIFYDRTGENVMDYQRINPPMPEQARLQYGYVSQIGQPGTDTLLSAYQYRMIQPNGLIPTRYSFSFGVQSKLPLSMVLDVSYVGALARHMLSNSNLNNVPYGAAFLPENQDPTKSSALPGGAAYDEIFLRAPYKNYAMVQFNESVLTSNYNGLQTSVNRRYAAGLMLGANYTWSKAMGVSGTRIDGNTRKANYGQQGSDRRHIFNLNFVYQLPAVFRSRVLHSMADGWQISGITTFQSGGPMSVGYTIPGTSNVNFTGSTTEGARIVAVGPKPETKSDDPYGRINAAAFTAPKTGSLGMESGIVHMYGPGINNWNLSVEKAFAVGERVRLRVRFDAFNAFNHTQFSGYNSRLQFKSFTDSTPVNLPYDSSGNLIWSQRNGFGTVSGARDPRIMQLYLRLQF